MRTLKLFLPLLLITLFVFTSCKKDSRFKINTKEDRIAVKINRFDKDLITTDTVNLSNSINTLYAKYNTFLPFFTENILDVQSTDTNTVKNLIHSFLSDTSFTSVNKKTLEVFDNVADIEKEVSDAYTYIHHYFPEVELPEIYFFVSGFNRSVMMNDKFIAFGTDMYLGADFAPYQQLTYQYLTKNMRRESMAVDIVSTTLFRMFVNKSTDDRLIDDMIFRGKIMYMLSVFMPTEKPENIIGYTTNEWNWSKKYRKEIWTTMIDHKDLFSSDQQLIRKYMNEAPFTAPVSQESPGRLGTWMGWQIVESYMNKNITIGLTDLMNDTNSQHILENSGFKP